MQPRYSKMLVSTYKITWYHNPENCNLLTHSHTAEDIELSYKYYATNITLSYFNKTFNGIALYYIIHDNFSYKCQIVFNTISMVSVHDLKLSHY